jgi:hypothetical protein
MSRNGAKTVDMEILHGIFQSDGFASSVRCFTVFSSNCILARIFHESLAATTKLVTRLRD